MVRFSILEGATCVLAFTSAVGASAMPARKANAPTPAAPAAAPAAEPAAIPAGSAKTLYFLSQSGGGKVLAIGTTPGSQPTTVYANAGSFPDGITVDKEAGHIYYTTMFMGSVRRIDLDGKNYKVIVPSGKFSVGKQITLVTENGVKKLYWADREGQKVWRANVDGTGLEIVVDTAKVQPTCSGSGCAQVVGIAVDTESKTVYWTQKGDGGVGSIRRTSTTIPAGKTGATRGDIQVLLDKLPEPIDLHYSKAHGLFWTDRGDDNIGGNTVNLLAIPAEARAAGTGAKFASKKLYGGLKEAIGVAVDEEANQLFTTDLYGNIYKSDLAGNGKTVFASGLGTLVGAALA